MTRTVGSVLLSVEGNFCWYWLQSLQILKQAEIAPRTAKGKTLDRFLGTRARECRSALQKVPTVGVCGKFNGWDRERLTSGDPGELNL